MNDVDCDLVGIGHRGNRPLQSQRPSCPDDHVHDGDGVNYDGTDLMAQAADPVVDTHSVHLVDRLPSELVPSVAGHPNDPLEPVHNDLCDYDHDQSAVDRGIDHYHDSD